MSGEGEGLLWVGKNWFDQDLPFPNEAKKEVRSVTNPWFKAYIFCKWLAGTPPPPKKKGLPANVGSPSRGGGFASFFLSPRGRDKAVEAAQAGSR